VVFVTTEGVVSAMTEVAVVSAMTEEVAASEMTEGVVVSEMIVAAVVSETTEVEDFEMIAAHVMVPVMTGDEGEMTTEVEMIDVVRTHLSNVQSLTLNHERLKPNLNLKRRKLKLHLLLQLQLQQLRPLQRVPYLAMRNQLIQLPKNELSRKN